MKLRVLMFASILALFTNSVSAAPVYTYNNFGQSGDLYGAGGNWIGDRDPDIDGTVMYLAGGSFEASVTGTLAGITTAMWGPGSDYTAQSSFRLSLYADNSGVEGAQVWSQTYSFDDIYCCYDSGNGVTDFTINNGDTLTLNANQTYWLVAETDLDVVGSFNWYIDNTNAPGDFHMAWYDEGQVLMCLNIIEVMARGLSLFQSTRYHFQLHFWLFGSSLLGMGLLRRTREKI